MCGIIAYNGTQSAQKIILKGLKRLEYRGYDSAGIALANDGDLTIFKSKGKIDSLEKLLNGRELVSHNGIGHTRWATHGEPSSKNAHPHYSATKKLVIVHNGIIENYNTLKKKLSSKGYTFRSDTDTEILLYLIEYIKEGKNCSLEKAVQLALNKIVGAYAIVIMSREEPDLLIAAKKSSPLIIGVGKEEFFIASDVAPILEYTNEVIYLGDEEIATIKGKHLEIKNATSSLLTPSIETLNIELNAIEKRGYEHFMLKEIFEQPQSVRDCMRGRVYAANGQLVLGGVRDYIEKLAQADRILIVACGTSWHAGLTAEYFFEETCRIPVEVEYASEFRYRNPIIRKGDIVIAISQSGETADTFAAIKLAKSKGAIILGVCNVVGSSIARSAHAGIYTHAGPEIGVASTKAFTAQIIVLYMMALHVAQKKNTLSKAQFHRFLTEMEQIPKKIAQVLRLNTKILRIAKTFKHATNFIYLGRGCNFPVALEGALKLKEISYIHAEGYPAAEMKHGPIALIDEKMPVVFLATKDSSYRKIISNIQEVKARRGEVILIVTKGDRNATQFSDYIIEIPATLELFTPLIAVIPLQLLSYHIAVLRKCDVDRPRNLAKSVTVE